MPARSVRMDRNGAKGVDNSSLMVCSSSTVILLMYLSSLRRSEVFSWPRSRLNSTALASNGVPSWKRTPLRRNRV